MAAEARFSDDYHATNDAPHVLDRLEKDANTIKVYLHFVDEAITRTEFPDSFIAWFEDEKELLQHATSRIKEYAKTVEKRLQSNRLVSGVQHALDVTEISKVQEQLVSSISTIGHMMAICRHDSSDSRAAALRAEKTERLRAQTESSIAECREESLGSCNACISLGESGGANSEHPPSFQDVLEKSGPYTRTARRTFFCVSNSGTGPSDPEITEADKPQQPLNLGTQDPDSQLSPAADLQSQSPRQGDSALYGAQPQSEHSSAGLTFPQLFALSTQSSSSHRPGTSILHNSWSIPDEVPNLSTPLTTQTSGPATAHEASYHRRYLPLRVEIETLGQLTIEIDRLQSGDLYSNVTAAILVLRDKLMGSAGMTAVQTAVVSKEQGIVPYKAENQRQPNSTVRLNRWYLAGVIEDLDTGFYSRLEIFALFALPPSEDEDPQMTDMILDSQMSSAGWKKARDPSHFPTVESVLGLYDPAAIRQATHAFNTATHGSSSWSLIWFASNFVTPKGPWPDALLLGGPDWCEKQLVATGGSSDVYKVMLSRSQQLYFTHQGPFALKMLRRGQEHLFVRELEAHMHFAATKHPHIVTLLMAYEQAGRSHLLFPWADGTLTTFFQSRAVSPSAEVILWLLGQFVGLAEALESIHCVSLVSEEDNGRGSGVAHCGSHGDIKPDNILWFQPLSQVNWNEDCGVLVITDFGLARLQQTDASRGSPVSTEGRGGTLAYAPPDSDHSPSYDVFSLGCVLMEVAAWIAGGPEAWQRFHSARFDDGNVPSYIAPQNRPIRLHSSLSDPKSIIELLIGEFRERLDRQSSLHDDLKAFLGQWCDVVERCLDVYAENRPSARDLVEFLKRAETRFLPPSSPSTPRAVGNPLLRLGAIEQETCDEKLKQERETRLEGCLSAENDLTSPGLAPIIPTSGNSRDKIPPEPTFLETTSVTVGPAETGRDPFSPYLGHSWLISSETTTQPELNLRAFGNELDIGNSNPGWQHLGSLGEHDSDHERPATSPDAVFGGEWDFGHIPPGMTGPSSLSCEPPVPRSEPHTDLSMQPFLPSNITWMSPIDSKMHFNPFPNWDIFTPHTGLGRGPSISQSSPTLHPPLWQRLRRGLLSRPIPGRDDACWRCRNSQTKCDEGTVTPCARCLSNLGNLGIPCLRGPVCDAGAEVPFLCHMPGKSQTTILPSALQPAAHLLREVSQRRKLTAKQLKGRQNGAGSSYRIFSKVINTNVPNIRVFNPFRELDFCLTEPPYDDLIAFIVWELEDNPNTVQLTGIESLEDLVSLLEAASLYEVKWGHHDRTKRLVYNSIQSLIYCLRALRFSAHGLLTFNSHTYCSQANGCISPALQDLTKYTHQYAKALGRALFSKRRDSHNIWPLIFYSFCIQQHVRFGLMTLEKRLQSPGSIEVHGPEPPLRSFSYLRTAVVLFEEISLQKNGRLAQKLQELQPNPSRYIPQPPQGSRAGGAASSWRNWHEEDISKFLRRMFGPPTRPAACGPSPSQPHFNSDAMITSTSAATITTLTQAPATERVTDQVVDGGFGNAEEGPWAIPPSKSESPGSIIESIDSRWTATTREDRSDMLTLLSGFSAASSTPYPRSIWSTLSDVEDELEEDDA